MGWLKRNLFFVIGGAVALVLLGAAGFYDYASWRHDQKAYADLTDVYTNLKNLSQSKPAPGKNGENIQLANEQTAQLRQWITQTTNYFQPIAPIPRAANGRLTDAAFSTALHATLAQLQQEAQAANVTLPPPSSTEAYAFSFAAHVDRLTFYPGSLEALATQLGDVKAISEVLFAAGVNALDGIERSQVSPDDAAGPPTDYISDQPVTTDLGVLTPYQVTFRGFSPEIARVLEGFATSPHGFIVQTITVLPASGAGAMAAGPGSGGYGQYPPGAASQAAAMAAYRQATYGATAGAMAPAAAVPGQGGAQTVLNEQLLSVTLKVEVVKLTPRN